MKKICLLAMLILMAFAARVQAQLNGVTAELKFDQDQYLPGEDLHLKLRILNRSGQVLTLGMDNDWLALSIINEKNVACNKTGDMPLAGPFSLLSGEQGTKMLNPTPYFDFSRLGRYRVIATLRIPQWNQEVICKPTHFNIGNGVPLLHLANLEFGLPQAPGSTNAPEVRKYSLLKVSFMKEIKLYFRLTDSAGKILHVFPLGRMTTFTEPEAQIDRFNNLHVLYQTGSRTFNYDEVDPEGQWVLRQMYAYTDTRPVLRVDTAGKIFVGGGERHSSEDDFPPSRESASTAP